MLVKFEQNRIFETIQNFKLFDKKWLTVFDKVLTPFWKTFLAHSSVTFVTQKSGKSHFWMATAPGTNMLSTNFWLIIVHPVRVKTYRSLKIKFFVKVKNKVHVTIGHVCDFARNYGPAQNDFKVKILWCVMEFCIEQYTDDGQHIYKQFHILRMKFYRQDFFWCNILFGHVCDILV